MLKAMLCVEDITETGVNLTPSNSFTVQEFHYDYGRRRDAMGRPYGPTESAYMDFTVKVSSDSRQLSVTSMHIRPPAYGASSSRSTSVGDSILTVWR